MEYPPQIEKLLEKYWTAETSVLEEGEIRNYFILHPEHADAHSAYFLMLEEEAGIEAAIRPQPIKITAVRPAWKRVVNVAAAIVLVAMAGFLVQNQLNETPSINQGAEQYSQDETDEAYAQAKQALLLVSQKLNSSQNRALKKLEVVEPYTTILK